MINFEIGDVLVIYTDGITEAMNDAGNFYGEEKFIRQVRKHRSLSAKEITQLLFEDVQKFSALGKYSDDKTIVTVKRMS
jgi:sigma-B regulation protein RsbU (phosphoserine phosphatase)